jgi:elongation factor P--(R)-beta-lysine ligase
MKRLSERARVLSTVRGFFDARGFLEVETPAMVHSPGMDLALDAFEVAGSDPGPRWLITSPEYHMKRLLAEGEPRIYQIARCFRRGEFGRLHNPEFTMLEWYRKGATIFEVARDTEQLVAAVTGGYVRLGNRTIDVRPPLERMTVCEAFAQFAGFSRDETLFSAADDPDRYFRAMVDLVEPALARLERGVFLVDYPATQASLARKKPGEPEVAERFELYVAGVELCNGFGELVDPIEQRSRFEQDQSHRRERGLPVYPIDECLLAALAFLPPSGGNALGLDRLVALSSGTTTISEVIAFIVQDR